MSVRQKPATRDRREQILAAAGRVIAERGLPETRISDIAEEAGVSPALILYYFESKDRVLVEALTHANDRFYLRMSGEVRRLPTAREKLIRFVELNCPGLLPDSDPENEWALWIEVWSRALRDPQMRKDHEMLDRRWRTSIAEIIKEGQASGEFPSGDAEESALRISSLIDGFGILAILRSGDAPPERMRGAVLEMASREVGFELD